MKTSALYWIFNIHGIYRYPLFLLLLISVFSYQKSMALSLDDFLDQLPVYTANLPIESPEKKAATTQLKVFAPFLLRGYQLLLEQMEENSARQEFEKVCVWIANNSSLSHKTIYSHIEKELYIERAASPFHASPVVFSQAVPPDELSVGAAALLRKLSAFSIDPLSGRTRLALHGSQGLEAQLYRFYSQGQKIFRQDWDFMIQSKDINDLLNALSVTEGRDDLEGILSGKVSPYSEKRVLFNDFALILSFKESAGIPSTRMLAIKYLKEDKERGVHRLDLSLDFFFVTTLPESSFLPFDSIGYLPVQEALPMARSLHAAIVAQPDFAPKYRSKLLRWQQLEREQNGITDKEELFSELMSEDYDWIPHELPERVKPAPEVKGIEQAKMPELVELFASMKEMNKSEVRKKLKSRLQQKIRRARTGTCTSDEYSDGRLQLDFDLENMTPLDNTSHPLDMTTSSPAVLLANFNAIVERIQNLWRFQTAAESNNFIQHFDATASKNCEACTYSIRNYLSYLFRSQVQVQKDLESLFQLIMSYTETAHDPHLLNLAGMTKALAVEMSIGADEHKKQLLEQESSLCAGMKRKLKASPNPFVLLTELYEFLHHSYNQLERVTKHRERPPCLVFRDILSQWHSHLRYINSWINHTGLDEAEKRRPHSAIDLPVLQLLVFGVVLNDIHGLSTCLPCSMAAATQHLASTPEGQDSELRSSRFNRGLERVLSSYSWKMVYDSGYPLPPEKAKELLNVLEQFPLNDNSHTQSFEDVRTYWNTLESELERKRSSTLKICQRNSDLLLKKEEALKKAREKLIQSKNERAQKRPKKPREVIAQGKYEELPIADIPSQVERPPTIAAWELNLRQAREDVSAGRYGEAKKKLNKTLSHSEIPNDIKAKVLVEYADCSLQTARKNMKEVNSIQPSIHYIHRIFQAMANPQSHESNHGRHVRRDELIHTARTMTSSWGEVERDVEQVTSNHLAAIEALKHLPEQGDSSIEWNIDLMTHSMDYMLEFHKQTLESRQLLQETFSLRHLWLQHMQQQQQQQQPPPAASTEEILSIMSKMEQQQKVHRQLYDKAIDAQKMVDSVHPHGMVRVPHRKN